MPIIKTKTDLSKPTTTGVRTHKGDNHIREKRINGMSCNAMCSMAPTEHALTLHQIDSPATSATAYPLDAPARSAFRTHNGKKLTEYQWAVYDFARTIPLGRVTTYSALSKAIGRGSPRSVGSALRHNPFAPFVPCHRVVASNLYIGGFFGEWGTLSSGTKGGALGKQCQRKIEMLAAEGVGFTTNGYLVDESFIWRG